MKRLVLFFTLLTSVVVLMTSASAATPYFLRNLGSVGGTSGCGAFGINDDGWVVGRKETPIGSTSHAFLWTREDGFTDLQTLGGSYSAALDINNNGQVVGIATTADGVCHPFRWQNGTMINLRPPPYGQGGGAYGINDDGVAVGHYNNFPCRFGDYITLHPYSGNAEAINSSGQIVGDARDSFLWEDGSITFLDDMHPWDINEAGIVAGTVRCGEDSNIHACIWDDSAVIDIGPINKTSYAFAINNSETIVGTSTFSGYHAAVWEDNVAYDLNDLIIGETDLELIEARDINDVGQIVGLARIQGEDMNYVFLLTPIPEPSMILVGLICFLWLSRKRINQ